VTSLFRFFVPFQKTKGSAIDLRKSISPGIMHFGWNRSPLPMSNTEMTVIIGFIKEAVLI
jgi:hypothetical protein